MTKVPRVLRPIHVQLMGLLRFLPRVTGPLVRPASRLFGASALPRRMAFSTVDHVETGGAPGAGVEVVHPAHTLSRSIPAGLPPRHWRFRQRAVVSNPAAFVATIPEGRSFFGTYGAVIAPPDTLLFDVSRYSAIGSAHAHPVFRRLKLPAPERIDETVAVLASRGMDNYYHFMLDVLPRIGMIERVMPLDDVGYFHVADGAPFQRALLEQWGIGRDRILRPSEHPHVLASTLVVPSLPAPDGQSPPWVAEYLRGKLATRAVEPTGRRFFVQRGEKKRTRRVTNEREVVDELGRLGFEAIRLERLSIPEQVGLFASAEAIVAPHGAGLTNVVFCRPGVTVVEIFAPTFVNVCFWGLGSNVEGLRYHYLLGEGRPAPPGHYLSDVSADITVSIPKLGAVLEMAGLSAVPPAVRMG